MKYSINSKVLVDALGRCATVSDGYVLTFTNRPVNADGSEVYATIAACTSSTISTITLIVKVEESSEKVAKLVVVGLDFAEAARALCKAGDTVTFVLKDKFLELSFGDAKIEVGYKDKVTNFAMKSPKDDAHAMFTIESNEWKRVIQQAGFTCASFDETSQHAAFNNIMLLPCIVGDEYGIRTCSTSSLHGSSSHSIVKEKDEAFVEMVNKVKSISIPPANMKSFINVLKGETVTIYIFDTQLMIRDGNDVFAMVLAASNFPTHILSLIDDTEYSYSLKADIADLKVALDIVSVNSPDTNKAVLILEINDAGVTFYAKETTNKAPVKAETEGTIRIGISIKRLKELITSGTTEVNQVVICGKNDTSFIHVRGGHCNAFILPVSLEQSKES